MILTKLKDMTNKDDIKAQIYEMETLKGEAEEEESKKDDDAEDSGKDVEIDE